MAELKSKLKVSVNKNPTKEGIKVQFVLPETLEGDAKAQATQKLQSKLNQGLQQYNLTVSQDTDVPYSNVIGFLIPIADVKLLIKNAIGGGSSEETPTEEAPKPEEKMNELKRMQQLAGLVEEAQMTYDPEDYSNQEMMFDFEGNTYVWMGDYRVEFYGEKSKISNINIVITRTAYLNNIDDLDTQVKATPAMLEALKAELEEEYIA
jgi:hypothetical protein